MSSSKENRKIENRISIDAEKTIKIIVETSAITTAFFGVLLKFISMGRNWHYQFDFDTFSLDISNNNLFLLLYFVICSIGGSLILLLCYKFFSLFEKMKKKPTLNEISSIIAAMILTFIISCVVGKVFNSKVVMWCTFILSVFNEIISFLFIPLIGKAQKSSQVVALAVIVLLIISLVFSGYLFHKEYYDAKEEKTFNIVQINDNYYAIINENSQEYSMYQCVLNNDEIIIYDNKNMVIEKNNVVYDTYYFDKVTFQGIYYKYNSEKTTYTEITELHQLDE